MPASKKALLLPDHSLESYKESARARRAALTLQLSGVRPQAEDGMQLAEKSQVTIVRQGGRVTVLLGEENLISAATKVAILGKS